MKNILYAFLIMTTVLMLNGCAGTTSDSGVAITLAPEQVSKLSDFNDHQFNHKVYLKGMLKVGHNILVWQDPKANLGEHQIVNVQGPSDRYLPVNPNLAHKPYLKSFRGFFDSNFDLKESASKNSLRIETAVVECNPGSRAARIWVGMGAGRAAATVVVEVYELGKDTPVLKIYTRDTASIGMFGGDSASMLNHIFQVMAVRVTADLEGRINIAKKAKSAKEI